MDRTVPASPGAPADVPWRRRHPVLARTALYGVGAALAVVGVVLLLERREVDRQDRLLALAATLDNLPLHLGDPESGAAVVSAALDKDFSDPALPPWLRGRVQRLRALVFEARGETALAEASYAGALALAPDAGERGAVVLEWAEARLRRRDAPGVRQTLANPADVPAGPMTLYREWVLAQAAGLEGAATQGARALDAALDRLPGPLPAGVEAHLGCQSWSYAKVALFATDWLASRTPASDRARLWSRVFDLAPRDFEVAVASARGLQEAGRTAEAREAWARARGLNPPQADRMARMDPLLRSLAGT
jgi:hypothetical protein